MSGETTGICPQAPSRTSELIASGSGTCPGPGRWLSKESLSKSSVISPTKLAAESCG